MTEDNGKKIPNLPERHCTKCGKQVVPRGEMKVKKHDGTWDSYNRYTGELLVSAEQEMACPDYKWWNGHAIGGLYYDSEKMDWS